MSKTQSKPVTARSRPVKKPKRKASKRRAHLGTSSPIVKTRAGTKNAQILAMLRDRAGTTIAAMVAATGWKDNSVRGFLAGVVRKKLNLNLVSDPGESGRLYRIIGKADRAKRAA